MTPPRPAVFAADKAPAFVEVRLDAYKTETGGVWWQSRPKITPRLQLVHTNGAKGEGSIESAINWGNASPALNTHPHYQVDRHRAAKLVPTDRKGIGNKTAPSHRGAHGDVADWSLVIETADAGYPTPGEDGGFIGDQVEMIAQILAYESILHGIPLAYPQQWFEAGTATHTDPFEYPYYTIAKGKVCPGRAKKQEMRAVVLPRAIEIRAAWLDEEDDMVTYAMRPQGYDNIFVVAGADAIQIASLEQLARYGLTKDDVQNFNHDQTLKSLLHKSGLTTNDLVKSKP